MRTIGIVGGRLTGTAAFAQLVRGLSAGNRIIVIDPEEAAFPPVFYEEDSQLFLNTSPDVCSILASEPYDFVDYLIANGLDPRMPPRHTVGRYADERYVQHLDLAERKGISVGRVAGTVSQISRDTDDCYALILTDGEVIEVTDVVLAMGRGPAKRIPGLETIEPYPAARLRESDDGPALVVGMGPSGIDAALTLASLGRPVHITSRHGFFPAVRTRTPWHKPIALPDTATEISVLREIRRALGLAGETLALADAETFPDALSLLEHDIAKSHPEVSPWQDTLADIVALLGTRRLTVTDPPTLLWRYVTSMMHPVALRLRDELRSGRISVIPINDIHGTDYATRVAAVGFHPYPISATSDRVALGDHASDEALPRLTTDLRLVLPGRSEPERIWAIGPSAQFGLPFANALPVTALHASTMASGIVSARVRTRVPLSNELA